MGQVCQAAKLSEVMPLAACVTLTARFRQASKPTTINPQDSGFERRARMRQAIRLALTPHSPKVA